MIYFETQSTFEMKNTNYYLDDIKEIRQMMEQSSRFLSLSGLSGVLIGIYALFGAFIGYRILYISPFFGDRQFHTNNIVWELIIIAGLVLFFSMATVIWLSLRKAKKSGEKIWNTASRIMLLNLSIPLITGGILTIILILRGVYGIVSPSCLIFYGLALINAAKFLRKEIFYMGLFQILLGLLAAVFPGNGLIFWTIGFGILHIIYGTIMHFRYDQ